MAAARCPCENSTLARSATARSLSSASPPTPSATRSASAKRPCSSRMRPRAIWAVGLSAPPMAERLGLGPSVLGASRRLESGGERRRHRRRLGRGRPERRHAMRGLCEGAAGKCGQREQDGSAEQWPVTHRGEPNTTRRGPHGASTRIAPPTSNEATSARRWMRRASRTAASNLPRRPGRPVAREAARDERRQHAPATVRRRQIDAPGRKLDDPAPPQRQDVDGVPSRDQVTSLDERGPGAELHERARRLPRLGDRPHTVARERLGLARVRGHERHARDELAREHPGRARREQAGRAPGRQHHGVEHHGGSRRSRQHRRHGANVGRRSERAELDRADALGTHHLSNLLDDRPRRKRPRRDQPVGRLHRHHRDDRAAEDARGVKGPQVGRDPRTTPRIATLRSQARTGPWRDPAAMAPRLGPPQRGEDALGPRVHLGSQRAEARVLADGLEHRTAVQPQQIR